MTVKRGDNYIQAVPGETSTKTSWDKNMEETGPDQTVPGENLHAKPLGIKKNGGNRARSM